MPASPNHVIRFINVRIESVPHIEALLLIYRKQTESWDALKLSKELFIDFNRAKELIKKLHSAGFIINEPDPQKYIFNKKTDQTILADVADAYSQHLIEITNLIHRQSEAQKFSDSFKIG